MDVKKLILLVGALVVAGISAFFARTLIVGNSTAEVQAAVVEQSGPRVLVATTALPIGTILSAESFKYQPWPKDLVQNAYYLEGETELEKMTGKVVRFSLPAGQPVTKGSVVGPNERGFLAAALTPGMRAVTVSISATSGVAGFVFPGDRVDLLLTHTIQPTGAGEDGIVRPALNVSETILRNVRVLAVDQRTNDTGSEDGGPNVGRTVTFEVPPKYVEKIVVAQTIGNISLALRPLAKDEHELEQAIAAGEVVVGDDQSADADRAMELAVVASASDRNPTYTTGGEVSRFAANLDPRPAAARSNKPAAGPSVRVFRGNQTTDVTVGAK